MEKANTFGMNNIKKTPITSYTIQGKLITPVVTTGVTSASGKYLDDVNAGYEAEYK